VTASPRSRQRATRVAPHALGRTVTEEAGCPKKEPVNAWLKLSHQGSPKPAGRKRFCTAAVNNSGPPCVDLGETFGDSCRAIESADEGRSIARRFPIFACRTSDEDTVPLSAMPALVPCNRRCHRLVTPGDRWHTGSATCSFDATCSSGSSRLHISHP